MGKRKINETTENINFDLQKINVPPENITTDMPEGVFVNSIDDTGLDNLSVPVQWEPKSTRGRFIKMCGIAVFICALCYAGGILYYKDKFFAGTSINGMDCSGLTISQSEKRLTDQAKNYAIELEFRDGTKGKIKGKDIDYKYLPDGSVAKIFEKQEPIKWGKGLLRKFGIIAPLELAATKNIKYDKGKLLGLLSSLNSMKPETQREPEDAYVIFKDNVFVAVEEKEGNKIDKNILMQGLVKALDGEKNKIAVADTGAYAEPKLRYNSKTILNEIDDLNFWAKASITFDLPHSQKTLDGNVIREWLKKDDIGHYYINDEEFEDKIKKYVKQLATETDTIGIARTFRSTLQGEITVKGGTYGWKIDQKAEIAKLKEDIIKNKVVEREPEYTIREKTKDNNGFGNTYIEIDLTHQKVWYYINGEIYVDSSCVSGTATVNERKTPSGTYTLTYRGKNKTLRGDLKEDGTYEYESFVNYWMPFNRGIGLHDATWRKSFGGKIYMYGGSHGCINLPLNKAAAIYEKIENDIPIVVFY